MKSTETILELLTQDIKYIKDGMDELKKNLKDEYVTKAEFNPVKNYVFGLIGTMSVFVLGSLLALLINK
jgi:hypothetical protein